MAWIFLAIAVVFEIVFALGTNATHGFTKLWPSVLTLVAAAGASSPSASHSGRWTSASATPSGPGSARSARSSSAL